MTIRKSGSDRAELNRFRSLRSVTKKSSSTKSTKSTKTSPKSSGSSSAGTKSTVRKPSTRSTGVSQARTPIGFSAKPNETRLARYSGTSTPAAPADRPDASVRPSVRRGLSGINLPAADLAAIRASATNPPSTELQRDIDAANEATERAASAHRAVETTPAPTSAPAADALTQKRDTARESTRDAVVAQQTANATAERLGEDIPFPAAAELPDAQDQSAEEANNAVSRSRNPRAILGRRPAVQAPEQEAKADADQARRDSGAAQTAVLTAERQLDSLRESGAPPSEISAAEGRLADANQDATDAARTSISAQQNANQVARDERQDIPFAAADDVPADVLADDRRLNGHLAAQDKSTQRALIGAHQQVDTPEGDAQAAIDRAAEAQRDLAATDPSLSTNSPERAAADQATQDAVQAQIEANTAAADRGDPVPYPAVDGIPEDVVGDPEQLTEHIARQSPETQRAVLGTEAALTDQVYAQDLNDARRGLNLEGPDGARALEGVAERYAGNPERVDQLITDLEPELGRVTDGLSEKSYGRDEAQATVNALGRVAELASPAGANAIADNIIERNGLANRGNNGELWYLDDGINNATNGQGIALGSALAERLDAAGSPRAAEDVRNDVVDNLNDLRSDVREAGEARESADAQLAEDLRDFSFLDEQEQADYISAYQQDNIEAYSGEADAAARLDEVVGRSGEALDNIAVKDSDHVDDVVGTYEDLAQTSLPGRALEWATGEKPPAVQEAFAGETEKIHDDVLLPATEGALLQFQAEAGGDQTAALDRFEAAFDQSKLAKSVVGQINTIRGAGTLEDLASSGADTVAVLRGLTTAQGRADYAQLLRNQGNTPNGFGKVDGAFAAAGFAFSVRNYGQAEGFVDTLTENVSLAKDGVEILARGIDTLNDAGRLGFLGGRGAAAATKFSRFAGRTVPYVNIALNAAATTQSVAAAIRDPSGGAILQAFGDGLSLVGSVAGAFPPAKPFAAVLEFGGLALSQAGAFWAGADDRNALDDAQQARLEKVFENRYPELRAELGEEGFAEAIRQTADASAPRAHEVADAGNLNSEQLLRLFGTVPPSNNRGFGPMVHHAEGLGLSGDNFVDAAQALHRASGGQEGLLGHPTLEALQRIGIRGPDVARALDQLHAAQGGGHEGAIKLFELERRLDSVETTYIPPDTPSDFRPQLEERHASDINRNYAGWLADAGLDLEAFGVDVDTL